MDNRVFVISSLGQTLMPCHPARARMLLTNGRAVCNKVYPFTGVISPILYVPTDEHPPAGRIWFSRQA